MKFYSLILLSLLMLKSAFAVDPIILPDIEIRTNNRDRSTDDDRPYGSLRLYVKNNGTDPLVIPTRCYGYTMSIKEDIVSVIVVLDPDESIRKIRVVRPIASFFPVTIKENEMAKLEIDFPWPYQADKKYDVRVIYEIDECTAKAYGFWGGIVRARCNTKMIGG